MRARQAGFSIVEISLTLLVIGMLLSGILKGQELIGSARVRNLADQSAHIQAAYFGFVDRYRRVPGDWDATNATIALGMVVVGGGNNSGQIDNPPGPNVYDETNAVWEQLAKAGFIKGSYLGTPGVEPTVDNGLAPLNSFNHAILLGRTSDYHGIASVRLHLVTGRGIPVKLLAELDRKIDNSEPATGSLRVAVSTPATFSGVNNWGASDTTCIDMTPPGSYDIEANSQDCNGVFHF